jgi:hypothetical protein
VSTTARPRPETKMGWSWSWAGALCVSVGGPEFGLGYVWFTYMGRTRPTGCSNPASGCLLLP